MIVTDRRLMQPNWESTLAAALRGGARMFQLREKDASDEDLLRLAHSARDICRANSSAQLVVNGNLKVAREIGAGLHLPEKAIETLPVARGALGARVLLGVSCHSLESAHRAQEKGADYLVFGSVFPTASHSDIQPFGLDALAKVCASVAIPVFAIGGINADNARACREAGAHGVAVIRAVWDAPDVELAARTLSEIVEE